MSVGDGDNHVRVLNNLYIGGSNSNIAWHAGNDGSGSGLDADTVDGVQAGNFRIINTEYSGSVSSAGWYTIAEYGSGRAQAEFHVYDQDSSRHNYVKLHVVWSFGNGGITCVSNGKHGYHITHARLLYNTSNQTYGGCKLQIYCANPSWTLRSLRQVGSQFSGYGAFTQTTIAKADSVSGFAEYSRASNLHLNGGLTTSGSTWYAANNLVWTAGNDGSGSGLDADLLDGQQGSYYQPASSAITTSATQGNHIYIYNTNPTIYFRDTDHLPAMLHNNSNLFYILRGNSNATTSWTTYSSTTANSWPMIINLTNSSPSVAFGPKNITAMGNTMWHAGNDGSGSGLDADLLDGNHASAFALLGGLVIIELFQTDGLQQEMPIIL